MLNVKRLLTKVLSMYVTESFNNTAETISAGTPGTFSAIQSKTISKTGYTPIGVINMSVGHPGSYQGFAWVNGSTLYFAFYRAGPSAYALPANDMLVTVLYRKN